MLIISPITPLPSIVDALIFLIFVIRLVDIAMSKLLAKFSISLIRSFDLYRGSPFNDG